VQETHEHHKLGRSIQKEHKLGQTAAKKWHNQIHFHGIGVKWWNCYLQYLTTMTWPGLMLLFGLLIYLQLFALAAVYWVSSQYFFDLDNGKFDAWNLAVQTYLTIGYGVLTPEDTWWGVLWGILATSLALFDVAVVTGVPYIKFSKPRCKVLFSSIITVSMHQGEPTLTIRMANLHQTPIFNMACTLYVVSMGKTTEGISVIKPIKLQLRTEDILVFQYNFVLQHKLNKESPLYHIWQSIGTNTLLINSEDQEEPLNLSLHATVQGNDALLQNIVHAHHIYHINDFRFDCRFDDMVVSSAVVASMGCALFWWVDVQHGASFLTDVFLSPLFFCTPHINCTTNTRFPNTNI
jgi:inward rectifier potassium channel